MPNYNANASNPWMDYFSNLPELSKSKLFDDPTGSDVSNAYQSVQSSGKGQNYRNWLNSYMPKYFQNYETSANEDAGVTNWVDFLGQINPDQDYSFLSNSQKGLGSVGGYAPTTRMNWGY